MKKERLSFAREFIRNRKQLGTPFTSSRSLAKTVANQVIGSNIVELGAGQGQITKAILHFNPDISLTAFEVNKGLFENLNELHNPRLVTLLKDAEEFSDYVSKFDCVISGLPLTSMPETSVHKILTASKDAERFIQYKYFPEGDLLKKYFLNVKTKLVLRNLPPALVYVCDNKNPLTKN